MDLSVSTQRAAQLLHVHESSIKRWCNAEVLACWYTPGGHRRIPLAALLDLARKQSVTCLLLDLPSYERQVWAGVNQVWAGDGYEALATLLYGWLRAGEEKLPGALFRLLLDLGVPLHAFLDHVLAPVLCKIGEEWQGHTLRVGDEHRMTEEIRDSLYELLFSFKKTSRVNGQARPVALVGCGPTESHDLGALMVRLVLAAVGWRVIYLGKRVPAEDFARQQIEQSASLMCVSFTPPQAMPDALHLVRILGHLYDGAHPYSLALGGSGVRGGQAILPASTPFLTLKCFEDLSTLTAWLAERESA